MGTATRSSAPAPPASRGASTSGGRSH
jgi:hypothetical protein